MIEKAKISDAAKVASLAICMWYSHTVVELTKEFEALIGNEENAVFLKYENGKPIGFAQCSLRHDYVEGTESSPVGYLEGIYIQDQFRNNGYAKELLAVCELWAKERDCTEFASDCEVTNSVSIQFHLGLGFTEANRVVCFSKKL